MTNHTLQYTKEHLDEVMKQEVEIGIGDSSNEEVIFTYKGKFVSYTVASNDSNLPVEFYFHTEYGTIKHFGISELKNIRVL